VNRPVFWVSIHLHRERPAVDHRRLENALTDGREVRGTMICQTSSSNTALAVIGKIVFD
jgi:hypothetical protein